MDIELDPRSQRELDEAVQKLADAAGKTVKEVLPAQMRLFAADLAFNTRPIGKDAGSKLEMEKRVSARIHAIYLPVGAAVNMLKSKDKKLASAFQGALRKKNYTQAAAILNRSVSGAGTFSVGDFDDGKLHKKQRFAKHVTRRLVVVYPAKIAGYAAKEIKLIGFAKGGFATAARQLGGVRGIPGFATRQKSPGTGTVTGDGKTLSVTMTNGVRYIRQALDKSGEGRATINRTRSINLVLKRMADRKIKQATNLLK